MDQAFIELLGLKDLKVPLKKYWPALGPNWDGLATLSDESVILVEAKANIKELASPPCGAESEASIKQILQSIADTQKYMGIAGNYARPELWFNAFYQYANRLAHLHFLSTLNGVSTHLVFLDIINDPDSGAEAVRSIREWENLTLLVESCLGLSPSKRLMKFVHHVHVDVSTL
ncbi:hypothetical protein [Rhodopirellula europaea]|uniref:hypothetical protein n=1 Tax=Rhodopirellula europaea TaxID=1263866 RepID=UPI003D2AC829